MQLLVTYDVNTTTPEGRKRLRQCAKACLDYGQRVQNSVFECQVAPAQFVELKARLLDIMDEKLDSDIAQNKLFCLLILRVIREAFGCSINGFFEMVKGSEDFLNLRFDIFRAAFGLIGE